MTMRIKCMWANQNGTPQRQQDCNKSKVLLKTNMKNVGETRFQNKSSKKIKRFRSAFTTYQTNYLENEFRKFPYIGNLQRKVVASSLNISERAVKIWFQNRRMKEKKEKNVKEHDNGNICSLNQESSTGEIPIAVNGQSPVETKLDTIPIVITKCNESDNKNLKCEGLTKTNSLTTDRTCKVFYGNHNYVSKIPSKPTMALHHTYVRCNMQPTPNSLNCKKYRDRYFRINKGNQNKDQDKKHEIFSIKRFIQMDERDHIKKIEALLGKHKINTSEENKKPSKKIKRFRSAFSTEQTSYLETEFKKMHYISSTQRKDIALILNIPEGAIKIWFQNRRMKNKKESSSNDHEDRIGRKVLTFPKHESNVLNTKQSTNGVVSCLKEPILDTCVYYELPSNGVSTVTSKEDNIVNVKANVKKQSSPYVCEMNTNDFNLADNGNTSSNYNIHGNNSCKHKDSCSNQHLDIPQDLSVKKQKPTNTQNMVPKVNNFLPNFYLNSYTPTVDFLWQPINILPIVPTGLSLTVNNSNIIQQVQQNKIEQVKCCCDCHAKISSVPTVIQQNNTGPHFVITTIPIGSKIENPS